MGGSLGLGFVIIILAVIWVALLFWTFRVPAPRLSQLLSFVGLLAVTAILAYIFFVRVLNQNPNPLKVAIARSLTSDKNIYLGDIVPGLYDLDYIRRLDTDWKEEEVKEEWVAFYQYDVSGAESGSPKGPYGAAIYDYDSCRPPAILSFELVPVSYDYLGQDSANMVVEDIMPYADPLSGGQNRPEVIVNGATRGVITDLNIFRKTGVELSCLQRQQWQAAHPGEALPNPLSYQNIGSFRSNYSVQRNGNAVTVVDRAPFERSQITIKRQYRPEAGSYYRPGTQVLLDPVEYSLGFGPGKPDDIPQVYYPEKAVLAFYLNLGKDKKNLDEAEGYLSPDAQSIYNMQTDPFGLSTAEDSVARARDKLARVLVWEIRYQPDITAEQLHQNRDVTVTVTGVDKDGNIDYAHSCHVTWTIVGVENASALPYGCEWRLESYWTTCVGGK